MTKIFKNKELAIRLENTEGLSCEAYTRGNGVLHPEQGNKIAHFGAGIATFAGVDSPISQVFGFGIDIHPTDELLEEVEDFFFDEHCTVYFEFCPFVNPALLSMLADRGYFILELSNVLVREIDATPEPRQQPLRVEIATDQNCELWTNVLARGWAASEESMEFMVDLAKSMYITESYTKVLAYDGDVPAGAGCIFIEGGVANLFAHSTLKEHRGRGVQASLIEASLNIARSASASIAMAATSPGSGSQRNFERAGFEVAYSRFKMALPYT